MGLRAGEVAGLALEDIDWRNGEVAVRGKGNRRDKLPLPADAGQAVAEWLRDGRPPGALDRCVFIPIKAPHRGLTSGGITQVVAAAAQRAGLGVIYAHRLRHSAATAIQRRGVASDATFRSWREEGDAGDSGGALPLPATDSSRETAGQSESIRTILHRTQRCLIQFRCV
jgi:integrase